MHSKYFDNKETREPEVRERLQMNALPKFLNHVIQKSPGWAAILSHIDVNGVNTKEALSMLPILRKLNLAELQLIDPPLGNLSTIEPRDFARIFSSPGKIYEPQPTGDDPWRMCRVMWAAGIRPGHIIFNCFGYHLTPGAWVVDLAAQKIGCSVIPAGVGNTEQQLEVIKHCKPDAYVGTPSFLRILIERLLDSKVGLSGLKRALVAGEPLSSDLRSWFYEMGVESVHQWYGTADVGTIAYESIPSDGMIIEEDVILEIVNPRTGEVVEYGEIGEVVVTNSDLSYPMIRIATGDLSAYLPGLSSCGRTNHRIKGWLGRAGDGAKARGMFIYPNQVKQIIEKLPYISRARIVISGEMAKDELQFEFELSDGTSEPLTDHMVAEIAGVARAITKLRVDAINVATGSIDVNAALLIDKRKFD